MHINVSRGKLLNDFGDIPCRYPMNLASVTSARSSMRRRGRDTGTE
jgi:hypothetical protein